MNEVYAKYVYGLAATPKRDDGQEKKIYSVWGCNENKRCQQTCYSEQNQESKDHRRCHRLSGKEKDTSGSDKKQGTCCMVVRTSTQGS